jgi:hypothetical protein
MASYVHSLDLYEVRGKLGLKGSVRMKILNHLIPLRAARINLVTL